MLNTWGFDTSSMDTSVRPQDDFYHYVNGGWIKKNKIPKDESRWGAFNILRHETEKQVHTLVEELLKKKSLPPGSPGQLVRDLYRSGMDMKRRNAKGIKPLAPYRALIARIRDDKSLELVLAKLHKLGITVPWGYMVDQDSKNSEKYVLNFYQRGIGMPDRDYYLKDDAEFVRVRTAYKKLIQKLLALAGHKNIQHSLETIMKIETMLAEYSMNKVDARDAEKTYNKKTYAQFKALAPSIHWDSFFKAAGIPRVQYMIVAQPAFIQKSTAFLKSLPVQEVQIYLEWHLILDAAPYLGDSFIKANFEFGGKTLSGLKVMRPLWRRVLGSVNGMAGFALGRMYVDKYFGREAQSRMDELVTNLFDAYEARMHKIGWMSPTTKKKAIYKLRAISRKIGYPSKWRSYKGLSVVPDDYFGNILRAGEYERRREIAKLKKRVDRAEWFMTPQTVNAYCNFTLNEIVFPAAILQPPFFGLSTDMAVNYGAIGSVIGHEMTHAFDDQGSKFDARGNMKSWWTKEDARRFAKKTKILVTQFDAFTVADGVKVNGKLTLGENIADLGGLVIAYDALQKYLEKHGRTDIDGYTPEQRFFFGFAQQEQELVRPEMAKLAALNDPHSPPLFRINAPLSHMPEFYTAFGVTKQNKMYRAPSKRARIW